MDMPEETYNVGISSTRPIKVKQSTNQCLAKYVLGVLSKKKMNTRLPLFVRKENYEGINVSNTLLRVIAATLSSLQRVRKRKLREVFQTFSTVRVKSYVSGE